MAADRDEVQREFDAFGAAGGMLKQSGSWYRASDEVITVLNLQKSQYSLSYYVNVGFWLRALGAEKYPKENKCHIRLRLETLLPDREEEIRALLDLERDVPSRAKRFHDILETELRPLLERASSLEGLRQLRRNGQLERAFVLGPAQTLLDQSLSPTSSA
jgi:hypothetical protein